MIPQYPGCPIRQLARPSCSNTWMGFMFIVCTGALQSISGRCQGEAAKMDDASGMRRPMARHPTAPESPSPSAGGTSAFSFNNFNAIQR